ncbi:hypothetical protein PENCOP_c006G06301 [Penicillium coprophilum]|uniref:Uncharacterized protein n=1 Tax=Penicillium coprophilum TaxID=36646 RepID=A0A1V6UP03_9EURO|nr:hypothetical protein PENCOP_c006G06301 [Penicillium coprophilum]
MEYNLKSFDNPNIYAETLVLVDARLREIPSLQEIVDWRRSDVPPDDLEEDYSDGGYSDDDDDVDNDSDFWRRAAD